MQAKRGRPRRADALTNAEAWADLCSRANPETGELPGGAALFADVWGWSARTAERWLAERIGAGVVLATGWGAGRTLRISPEALATNKGVLSLMPHRAVLRYHGGKWQLAPWIISHFPAHTCYTETFGGAASVLMRKPRSVGEVYNDMSEELGNLFRVLQSPADAARLRKALLATPFSRAEFVASWAPAEDALEQARRTIVRSFFGFGSTAGAGGRTGFRSGMRGAKHSAAVTWSNYADSMDAFTARLAGVTLEGPRPAADVMLQYDQPDTLHYVDPPYPHDTRAAGMGSGRGYRFEMDDADHRALAVTLHSLRGHVVLSGYACDLYDRELYPDWHRVTKDTHADGALDRTEVLWVNPKDDAVQQHLTRHRTPRAAPAGRGQPSHHYPPRQTRAPIHDGKATNTDRDKRHQGDDGARPRAGEADG